MFVNEPGRLNIAEEKLRKNPQARREVVAQTLHYVSALSDWSYADLQRQVASAVGKQGNIPFELVKRHAGGKVSEPQFVDAVGRCLREGRILALLVGDGIREGVQALTELVNRSATKAFSFGLIEAALYSFEKNRFALQPRVLAETEVVTRHMTIVHTKDGGSPVVIEETDDPDEPKERLSSGRQHLKSWWKPILTMRFDDPEQEAPFWLVPNNAVLNTPFPGIQIKAYSLKGGTQIGVFVSGPRRANVMMIQKYLRRERDSLLRALPKGTEVNAGSCKIAIAEFDLESDDEKREWIMKTLNAFANVLRPRLRKWYQESIR